MSIVAVVGLGYVGLPLAVEFGKKMKTIGFDLSQAKIDNYRKFVDPTGEVTTAELAAAKQLDGDHRPGRAGAGGFHHRRGAHARRRGAPAGPDAARGRERSRSGGT